MNEFSNIMKGDFSHLNLKNSILIFKMLSIKEITCYQHVTILTTQIISNNYIIIVTESLMFVLVCTIKTIR